MKWPGLLGGAALLLAGTWVFARAPSPPSPAPERTLRATHTPEEPPLIHLRVSPGERRDVAELPVRPRNPFTFAAPERAAAAASSATAALPEPAPLPLGPLPAAPTLRLIGIAAETSPAGVRRTAFLTDVSGELYLVFEGELVAGRYEVRVIGEERVELTERDGETTRLRVLRLDGAGEQKDGPFR